MALYDGSDVFARICRRLPISEGTLESARHRAVDSPRTKRTGSRPNADSHGYISRPANGPSRRLPCRSRRDAISAAHLHAGSALRYLSNRERKIVLCCALTPLPQTQIEGFASPSAHIAGRIKYEKIITGYLAVLADGIGARCAAPLPCGATTAISGDGYRRGVGLTWPSRNCC